VSGYTGRFSLLGPPWVTAIAAPPARLLIAPRLLARTNAPASQQSARSHEGCIELKRPVGEKRVPQALLESPWLKERPLLRWLDVDTGGLSSCGTALAKSQQLSGLSWEPRWN
jgi:hypothetical protein